MGALGSAGGRAVARAGCPSARLWSAVGWSCCSCPAWPVAALLDRVGVWRGLLKKEERILLENVASMLKEYTKKMIMICASALMNRRDDSWKIYWKAVKVEVVDCYSRRIEDELRRPKSPAGEEKKTSWPEVVGESIEEAKEIILRTCLTQTSSSSQPARR
ncbi:hypothetical protein ZWY2020_008470 [Hordeum vulgare]|nr:hypothetical protein ZWY2020_008470 [Hordeum vulgare]